MCWEKFINLFLENAHVVTPADDCVRRTLAIAKTDEKKELMENMLAIQVYLFVQ